MQKTHAQSLKTKPAYLLTAICTGLLAFSLNSFATTSYEPKSNYPEDPQTCVVGETYDDFNEDYGFIYSCESTGKLCPTYCVAYSEDDDDYLAMAPNERITYNAEGLLLCTLDGSGTLSLTYEDVTTTTVADSQSSCP